MITLVQIAELFEKELNGNLPAFSSVQFKIWARAGKYKKPLREGNTVKFTILGNLRTATSANDANNQLVMGINGLTLDFMIPVYPPRTQSTQTDSNLVETEDGHYPFVEKIAGIINGYFKQARVYELKDEITKTYYSVAFQAGTVEAGAVDAAAKYGNSLPLSVYIQVYFIQGGINSQDVNISIDSEFIPFQAIRPGRAAVLERDVYAGETVSKCLASSTAFTIDADFPASNNAATKTALSYLVNGEANVAHFVNVKWGDNIEKLFFMAYNTVHGSATGIAVAGLSASLVEVGSNEEIYGLPWHYATVRFTINNSTTKTLSFTLSRECNTFIAGVGAVTRSKAQTVTLAPNSFEYSQEQGVYYVNMVVDSRTVRVTDASAPFEII